MGPPLKAAENVVDDLSHNSPSIASIGPPLKAAENNNLYVARWPVTSASMGPPLKAAENQKNPSRTITQTRPTLQWGRR